MYESYWDYLPLELQCMILEFRDSQEKIEVEAHKKKFNLIKNDIHNCRASFQRHRPYRFVSYNYITEDFKDAQLTGLRVQFFSKFDKKHIFVYLPNCVYTDFGSARASFKSRSQYFYCTTY